MRMLSLLLLLIAFVCNSAAQGTGGTGMILKNCYQSVVLEGGESYNMLLGDFKFDKFGTTDPGGHIQIHPFTSSGTAIPFDYTLFEDTLMGWELEDIVVIELDSGGVIQNVTSEQTFRIFDSINGWFEEWFYVPSNTDYFIIDFFTHNELYGEYLKSSEVTINIKDSESSIQIIDQNGDSCQTFDNYNIDFNLLLDGFCGNVIAALSKLPGDITDPTDPNNSQPVNFGVSNDMSNLEEHCSTCVNAVPSEPQPLYPVPCRCRDFKLEITYEPCSDMFPCPNLTFKLDEELCCRCDIRTNNNPGN